MKHFQPLFLDMRVRFNCLQENIIKYDTSNLQKGALLLPERDKGHGDLWRSTLASPPAGQPKYGCSEVVVFAVPCRSRS
jgi:hypothetical protein